MTQRMVLFFPAEFTAIAQWLVCTVHILNSRIHVRGWRAFVLIGFALPILLLLNEAHSGQPTLIWLVVTACCLASLMIYLRLGIQEKGTMIINHWCNALMQSEFFAALAWLINGILVGEEVLKFPDVSASQSVMAAVYIIALILLEAIYYRQNRRRDYVRELAPREISVNLTIAFGCYLMSNTSFVLPDSILGIGIGAGILYVRVMADLLGMVALFAFDEFCYAIRLDSDVRVMQGLLERQYEQYQNSKANNEQMRQISHDIKHLIAYIRSASSTQKYEKELRNMEDLVAAYESQYNTGNSVLDVVLGSKKLLCRSNQTTMECYVDAREMTFIDPVHICTIFGNALDNAIEYECRIPEIEKRLIKVNMSTENHFLMIHISNYCEEQVLNSSEDPKTTKSNPEMHGFGIKGIRLTVEQYNGHMNIKQENNWFIVSMLIPIPDQSGQHLTDDEPTGG